MFSVLVNICHREILSFATEYNILCLDVFLCQIKNYRQEKVIWSHCTQFLARGAFVSALVREGDTPPALTHRRLDPRAFGAQPLAFPLPKY